MRPYKKPRRRRSLNSELKDYYALGRALARDSQPNIQNIPIKTPEGTRVRLVLDTVKE